MSQDLIQVQVDLFISEVKHKYQEMGGQLRNTVRMKSAKGGQVVKFPLMGRGSAQRRTNYQTPLPIMNVSHEHKTATMEDWTASELTDIFLNNKVAFDERQELAETVANALRRREDQFIIDALVAAGLSKTVPTNISGGADDLTLDALREGKRLMDKDGVPEGERFWLTHVNNLHHLLDDPEVTSADFNTVRALVSGDLDSYYGFKFIKIGDRPEEDDGANQGGLPIDGANVRKNYAYHKMAVGLGINMEPKIEVHYESMFGAHRITGFLSGGAVVVDELGAVEIENDES